MSAFIETYEYQEITVSSIDEIIEIIQSYNTYYHLPRPGRGSADDKSTYLQTFFRGQSDSQWKIEPSIQRNTVEKKNVDMRMLMEEENKSLFDVIAHIQHYETGTRFIDFSTDFKVSLYFACSENLEKEGALYLIGYAPHKSEWDTAIIQAELHLASEREKMSIQEFSESILEKYPYMKEKYDTTTDLCTTIVSFLDHGFIAVAPDICEKDNLRIKRQSGCFFICGVKFEKPLDSFRRRSSNAGSNYFFPDSVVVPECLQNGMRLVKILIPPDLKSTILDYLKENGITEEYLMPEE